MSFPFYKYQGTGNDFVMIDNREQSFNKENFKLITLLCDRKFGVGADGLILLENHPTADFKMLYYNADGQLGSMCGNGGRCVVHFAKHIAIVDSTAVFEAVDGMHRATIDGNIVSLKMGNVSEIKISERHIFLNTGSPHHVEMVNNLEAFDVKKKGAQIRHEVYGKEGANVNFVAALEENVFSVRTYERGVEDETLSCGTGVTAVALALFESGRIKVNTVTLRTLGGTLKVSFLKTENGYEDVFLEGPAMQVYKGNWT